MASKSKVCSSTVGATITVLLAAYFVTSALAGCKRIPIPPLPPLPPLAPFPPLPPLTPLPPTPPLPPLTPLPPTPPFPFFPPFPPTPPLPFLPPLPFTPSQSGGVATSNGARLPHSRTMLEPYGFGPEDGCIAAKCSVIDPCCPGCLCLPLVGTTGGFCIGFCCIFSA